MDFGTLFEALGIGGTGIAVTLGVLALFWKADEGLSEEFRETVATQLQRLKRSEPQEDWANAFAVMFDHIFGSKHFSLRCFYKSCVASSVCFAFMAVIILLTRTVDEFARTIQFILFMFMGFGMTFNFLGDFFSLFETRIVLGWITRSRSTIIVASLLMLDFVATTILIILFSIVAAPVFFFISENVLAVKDPSAAPTQWWAPGILSAMIIGAFVATTYFTSIWVWLYALSWFAIRTAARSKPLLNLLLFAFPIKTRPMRAIGEIAAIVTALGYGTTAILA